MRQIIAKANQWEDIASRSSTAAGQAARMITLIVEKMVRLDEVRYTPASMYTPYPCNLGKLGLTKFQSSFFVFRFNRTAFTKTVVYAVDHRRSTRLYQRLYERSS